MVTHTDLAAHDAVPAPAPRPPQLAVYFVEDGSPSEVPGVEIIEMGVENPTTENPDAPELSLTLLYEPDNPRHRALLDACDNGERVTLRVVTRDASGRAVAYRETDWKVVRYRLTMSDRFREDSHRLRVDIDLEAAGELSETA